MINPAIVAGQVRGAVVQGIGGALLEETAYDEAGQPLASTFADYLLPTSTDVRRNRGRALRVAVTLHARRHQGDGRVGADRRARRDRDGGRGRARSVGGGIERLPLSRSPSSA